jgi:NADPH:quinone reductase-like Zn-dependent oxidoreductase
MKAIVYQAYGPPGVLGLAERPAPVPKKGELLVRVRAVEATKADCEFRSFRFAVSWFVLPLRLFVGILRPRKEILGSYFSGVVHEVGEGVSGWSVGDELFGAGRLRFGAYAEYLTIPAHYTLVKKPPNLSFEEVAAVPLGGLNALHFLRKAQLRKGERLLINGAGGRIGTFAVVIAKALGAHVTAVDAPHKGAPLRALGVDEYIDYTAADFSSLEGEFDVVFDMVPGSSYGKCLAVLSPHGRYVHANPTLNKMVRCVFTSLFTKRKASFAFADETQEELSTLAGMLESGEIRSPVDRILPLEQAAVAHHRVEAEERCGVVVLAVDPGVRPAE